MTDSSSALCYSIGEVERDTGLGKDTLRVWERRYGFPSPQRDAQGERLYSAETLARLRLICRLMLAGHRPGQLVRLTPEALEALAATTQRASAATPAPALRLAPSARHLAATPPPPGSPEAALRALHAQDAAALRAELDQALGSLGLAAFCVHWLAPTLRRVGDAWVAGELGVHQEHLFSEAVQSLLRQALYALPPTPASAQPRVLLSTLPGEPHGLGLLMAEALLALEGCACVSLGVQTPVDALVLAAQAQAVDVVALSASVALPAQQLRSLAGQLRQRLPAAVALWLGGEACRPRRGAAVPWLALPELTDIAPAVRRWRAAANGALAVPADVAG